MKTTGVNTKHSPKMKANPALDKLPLPKWAAEKAEQAKEFLKKHPIPENLIKRS